MYTRIKPEANKNQIELQEGPPDSFTNIQNANLNCEIDDCINKAKYTCTDCRRSSSATR